MSSHLLPIVNIAQLLPQITLLFLIFHLNNICINFDIDI